MQTANRKFGFDRRVLRLAGMLMVAVVLGCGLLSASPALHRLVHADAGSPDHGCIITMFTKGQIMPVPEVEISTGLALLFGGVRLLAETVAFGSADDRFSSSRAPPRFLV